MPSPTTSAATVKSLEATAAGVLTSGAQTAASSARPARALSAASVPRARARQWPRTPERPLPVPLGCDPPGWQGLRSRASKSKADTMRPCHGIPVLSSLHSLPLPINCHEFGRPRMLRTWWQNSRGGAPPIESTLSVRSNLCCRIHSWNTSARSGMPTRAISSATRAPCCFRLTVLALRAGHDRGHACGTPVIAFAQGSVPEVIKDGITGFLVRDVDEAVQTIGQLHTGPTRDPPPLRAAILSDPHGA
jgi:Glycosyl transferases group 1